MSNIKKRAPQHDLNPLAYSCLSIINDKVMTGYALSRYLEIEWKPSHQQVYRELKAMEKLELVEFVIQKNNGKPDSKVYSITILGVEKLEAYRTKEVSEDKVETVAVRGTGIAMMLAGNLNYAYTQLKVLPEQIEFAAERLETLSEPKELLMAMRHLNQLRLELDFAQTVVHMLA